MGEEREKYEKESTKKALNAGTLRPEVNFNKK